MKTDNEKLPPVELAAALGVSVVTVYRWKKQGCPCVEEKPNRAGVTGSRPRYNLQAVRAWLKQRNEMGKGGVEMSKHAEVTSKYQAKC